MPIYPKHAALLSPGRNWEVVDRPPLSSAKIVSVYQLCDASLWEDPECTTEEFWNGLDCRDRHDWVHSYFSNDGTPQQEEKQQKQQEE